MIARATVKDTHSKQYMRTEHDRPITHTTKLRAAVNAHVTLTRDQPGKEPNGGYRGGHEVPPLNEEGLLATDGCWERKEIFSLGM